MRNKIIQKQLNLEDCDNIEVFKFLSLLKIPNERSKQQTALISIDEWKDSVK